MFFFVRCRPHYWSRVGGAGSASSSLTPHSVDYGPPAGAVATIEGLGRPSPLIRRPPVSRRSIAHVLSSPQLAQNERRYTYSNLFDECDG